MKLIHFFIVFVLLIAASLGVTIVSTKGEPTTLLYVAEGLCVVALLFLLYFYRKVMRPIKSISSGMELLMEQDLTTRLTTVGQKETDRIVRVFNRLLDSANRTTFSTCSSTHHRWESLSSASTTRWTVATMLH